MYLLEECLGQYQNGNYPLLVGILGLRSKVFLQLNAAMVVLVVELPHLSVRGPPLAPPHTG